MLTKGLLRISGVIYHIQNQIFYVYIKYFKCWRLMNKIVLILYLNYKWEQSKNQMNWKTHSKKDLRLIL